MSAPWLFLPELPASAPATCRVHADEARHATGSRRLRAGDSIRLFDGRGCIADAVLTLLNSNGSLDVSVGSVCVMPRPQPDLEVASAIPKGDRLTTLLESIAPLAASRWTPLRCTHSIVTWSPASAMRAVRVMTAACKQSHQPWLPIVAAESSPIQVTRDAIARGRRVLIAHPGGSAISLDIRTGDACTILIGPEGGFTSDEVDAVTALGGEATTLGSSILRIELAVAYALARLRG